MKSAVLLSGENIDLAIAELKGVISSLGSDEKVVLEDGRGIFFNGPVPEGTVHRMGFSHFSGNISFFKDKKEILIEQSLKAALEDADTDLSISIKLISPDGSGAFSRTYLFEKFNELARKGGFKLHHRSPEQRVFLMIGENICSGIIKEEAKRDLISNRKGSRMPFNRPIVMEPKLARVMVNLSGLKPGSTILDPFMGPAGLALEAAHLSHRVIGIERDIEIFRGAIRNIHAQEMEGVISPFNGDSREMDKLEFWNEVECIDGIVTDPPFGRSAPLMGEDPTSLIIDVIEKGSEKMDKGSPLIIDTDRSDNINKIDGFKVEDIFQFRVHKSLTRYIGVLKKK